MRNVTIPHIEKPIKVVSQVLLKYTIVKYPNIFKDSSVNRVTKFQTIVGHFVLQSLNTMEIFFNRNNFYISPWKLSNLIGTFTINK